MRKKNLNKKLFATIATLALSATAVCGAVSFAGCSDKNSYSPSDSVQSNGKYSIISTARGAVRSEASGNIYYTSPDGKNGATGTMEDPFNISDILNGSTLKAGDTLYVLPGTYDLSTGIRMSRANITGTFDKYIRVVNAAFESASGYTGTEKRATLDFSRMFFDSTNRGVQIDTDFVHWYGIDVCGAGDNGLYIGGNYNTVEYSEFYNNRDSGLQLGRSYSEYNSISQWPSYNLVKNCTSHNNYDNETYGEDADGFAAKLTIGYGNVFDGCIAYRNSDDGWDLYAKAESGNIGAVIMYNCVAYENGYLEYDRDTCNKLFPTYNKDLDAKETSTNPYMTRDGDGNGFKLGGSVMEGDVVMYNCLSFGNRMHGVTDNSNPGYIKITGVTSYNNSAAVDGEGRIAKVQNYDVHSNIDLSRQTYSYNTVNDTLSVRDSLTKYAVSDGVEKDNLDSDNYRGTVFNSLLDGGSKTNVINGSIECDTINGGKTNVSQKDLINSATMFKKLPIVDNGDGTLTYNLDGSHDSMEITENAEGVNVVTKLLDTRAHVVYRNADESINMGDILAKSEAGEQLIASYLGEGVTIGSDLNKTKWEDYTHFFAKDLADSTASSQDMATALRAKDTLTVNCDENGVYQDFEVPVSMYGVTISWTSDDTEHLIVTDKKNSSVSGSEYILVEVYRDSQEDKTVHLTATIKCGEATVNREFTLILKQGTPSVGTIYTVDKNGERVEDGGRYIVDRFNVYSEPVVKVKNGLYLDSEKLLKESEYDVTTTYMYQTDANAHAVQIKEFTPSVAGVYTVTKTVTLKNDAKAKTMTYKIYVAGVDAQVDFVEPATVSVYQDGFVITGEPGSATGSLYALSSATELTLTKDSIKMAQGVVAKPFRDTSITFNFENDNNAEYYVYYALTNANGVVTSEVYSTKISKVDIDDTAKFMKLAGGDKIGDEEPSQTLYMLTTDLDFTGVAFARSKNNFTGVFNGLGHKISNLTIDTKDSTDKNIGIFYKVAGGTVMNVKFDNLSVVTKSTEKIGGLVSECTGGYFYNIAFTNISISAPSGARVAGLIGHVGGTSDGKGKVYPLYISQISIVNDADHKIAGDTRVAGIIGYVQHYRNSISIDNCYVVTDIDAAGSKGEGGGIVASWEDNYEPDHLTIERCYYSGQLKTAAAPGSSRLGGMLGYHKGGRGHLKVRHCISLATFHIQDALRDASVKNASPILGQCSGNADVTVEYCIGLMQEYNSNYDVSVFTETNLRRNSVYIEGTGYLNLDTKTRWTVVLADEPDKHKDDIYKAPYVVLNFLGDWN